MTLDEYLSQPGQTASALAAKAGTTGASINRILHGEQKPSASMVRALVEATDGAVTADDLIFGAPREKSRASEEIPLGSQAGMATEGRGGVSGDMAAPIVLP